MIRSNFAITRLIILPYGALLALYMLVVGGGGAWLYLQVRAVETRSLIGGLLARAGPLADRLSSVDAIASMEEPDAWLVSGVRDLFAEYPSLRGVFVRGQDRGLEMGVAADGAVSTRAAAPLPPDRRRASADPPPAQRLHAESGARFLIRFDLTPATEPLVSLDLSFDRPMLLARVNAGLGAISQAILWFSLAGGASILLAVGITVIAMRTTRQVERYFQEIYRRASVTEMAAELVHDLRNPLTVLRTNIKALLVSPDHTREIVDELDRDIVALNDKLSGFLKLTRSHDDSFAPTDIGALIRDAARLAGPVLARHGLEIELDIPPDLPRPVLQEAAIHDALLNVIINAAESGQKEGSVLVRVETQPREGAMVIVVEDRGDGIPDEHLPRLFDAFFTTKPQGNGLGLAIVQRVVRAHHGRIRAENLPQGGARIVITLPLEQKEPPHWLKSLKKISRT